MAAMTAGVVEGADFTVDVANEKDRLARHGCRIARLRNLVGAPDHEPGAREPVGVLEPEKAGIGIDLTRQPVAEPTEAKDPVALRRGDEVEKGGTGHALCAPLHRD